MAIKTPLKAWFCHVPLDILKVQNVRRNEPWFLALVESIKTDGLASPIIVDNRINWRVAVGMNRTRAMRQLGWKHCPAIVYGREPPFPAVLTPTIQSINGYLRDGEVYETHDGGLLLKGYHAPENMTYPDNKEPYYGGETV